MSERLCNPCKDLGYCQFRNLAEGVATQANSDQITAASAHQQISGLRTQARSQRCPNVNRVDPNYKGKSKL